MALTAPSMDAGMALAAVMQQLGMAGEGPPSEELVQHAVDACRLAGNKAFRAKDYRGEGAGRQGPARPSGGGGKGGGRQKSKGQWRQHPSA